MAFLMAPVQRCSAARMRIVDSHTHTNGTAGECGTLCANTSNTIGVKIHKTTPNAIISVGKFRNTFSEMQTQTMRALHRHDYPVIHSRNREEKATTSTTTTTMSTTMRQRRPTDSQSTAWSSGLCVLGMFGCFSPSSSSSLARSLPPSLALACGALCLALVFALDADYTEYQTASKILLLFREFVSVCVHGECSGSVCTLKIQTK